MCMKSSFSRMEIASIAALESTHEGVLANGRYVLRIEIEDNGAKGARNKTVAKDDASARIKRAR